MLMFKVDHVNSEGKDFSRDTKTDSIRLKTRTELEKLITALGRRVLRLETVIPGIRDNKT